MLKKKLINQFMTLWIHIVIPNCLREFADVIKILFTLGPRILRFWTENRFKKSVVDLLINLKISHYINSNSNCILGFPDGIFVQSEKFGSISSPA